MEIIVYSFKKKFNSTKRVTPQLALQNTPMECTIKNSGCGICNPIIEINFGLDYSPTNFNYAYIPLFKRYYFITDWQTSQHSLWIGILQEDFLATWKSAIADTNAYVIRSSSNYDTDIADAEYVATSNITISSREIPNPFNLAGGGELPAGDPGYYIIGINGENEIPYGSAGSVTYYVFEPISMQILANKLMHDIEYLNIDWDGDSKKFITEDLLKSLYNPLQYIASCYWLPDFPADKGEDINELSFGFWKIEIIGRKLTTKELTETIIRRMEIPKHPQSGSYGKWCNLAPYTQYQVHVSPYGLIDVPPDELINSDTLAVETVIDYTTGQGRMMIASQQRFIQIVNFQYGAEIQLSQLVQNPIKALTSGLSYNLRTTEGHNLKIAQNLAPLNLSGLANTMVGDIEAGLQAIGDLTSAMSPTVQSTGSGGARAWYYTGEIFWRISGKFANLTQRGDSVLGRPLCQMARLGDLSGYILCENASVECEGNAEELAAVNGFLNRGFYYE